MKINFIATGLLLLLLGACKSPQKFLPPVTAVDVNEHGSYIKLWLKDLTTARGELIALDSNTVVVLSLKTQTCRVISMDEVDTFQLRYAKKKRYWAAIPGFVAYPILHGLLSVFTMPLHLIVTLSVSATGSREFSYDEDTISLEQLKMFARFPQGIPPNVDVTQIR